jgi:hypothetical protein
VGAVSALIDLDAPGQPGPGVSRWTVAAREAVEPATGRGLSEKRVPQSANWLVTSRSANPKASRFRIFAK